MVTRRELVKILGASVAAAQFPKPLFSSILTNIPEKASVGTYQSSFDPQRGEWSIQWPERVSQHDLVYKSPPIDPLSGIPLGNGDVGALIWCEESKIIIAVNKSDLWEDAIFERFRNWSEKEEDYSTTLRHACRIIIDFRVPIFSTLFLSDFSGRLSLADGSMRLMADSPFGRLELKMMIDYSTGTILCTVKTEFKEEVPTKIHLERFGSRTFSHWYRRINRDATIGTSGTTALADEQGAYIVQQLNKSSFAVGGTVIRHNGLAIGYEKEHSRSSLITLGNQRKKEVEVAFTVTSPDNSGAIDELKKRLNVVSSAGLESFEKSNAILWKSLWSRSFVDYGDPYLTQLWHLTIYYALTSQGGKYPGRFINGLWGWNRDVQNWNFYFHWNQQQLYWPLNAAGYHEHIIPYLDYRFRALPHAMKDAREYLDSNGAFISDVAERRGFNSLNELHNHTPVAEIALEFWRQYQYTFDKEFLLNKALPFIMEAARFFESLFTKESDGLYHAKEGTGYEGWIRLRDSLTELVYGRVLFSVAIEAVEVAGLSFPETKRWQDIRDNLVPLPIVEADSTCISQDSKGYRLSAGYFKGRSIPTNKITAAGWGIEEKRWLTVYYPKADEKYNGLKLLDGIFPTVTSAAVFPSNYIGLSQLENNDEQFGAVMTTALLYSPGITGWDPTPIVLARLGLADELEEVLDHFPKRWQIYNNGWGHWGLEGEINKDAEWFFRTNEVSDVASKNDDRFPLPTWPFRHTSMESMAVLATSMNESLLQSHDGVIRIAPAFSSTNHGRFTLHAVGGFEVSAEVRGGDIGWVCVKNLYGNPCQIKVPWDELDVYLNGIKIPTTLEVHNLVSLEMNQGDIALLTPHNADIKAIFGVTEEPSQNNEVKVHSSGKTRLGIPRMF